MSTYGCSDDPGVYTVPGCSIVSGRVRNMSLVRDDAYAGWSNFELIAEWDTEELNGRVIKIRKTRGDKPKDSPNFSDGFGDKDQELVGREHTATIQIEWDKANRDFMNTLSKSDVWHVALQFGTGANETHLISTVPATIVASHVGENDTKTKLIYELDISWSDIDMALAKLVPSGLYS